MCHFLFLFCFYCLDLFSAKYRNETRYLCLNFHSTFFLLFLISFLINIVKEIHDFCFKFFSVLFLLFWFLFC